MALILTYTDKVRAALKERASIGVDVMLLMAIAGLATALYSLFSHVNAPRSQAVAIDLSFKKLPLYTFYSLSRGFAAYAISLAFTLVYGTISAHNRVAEKIMVPVLDVLQSLPVLTLLPIVEIAMLRMFPTTWLGPELTCVILIFTAQAWNMTFSYFGSVRSIPTSLREAAAMQRLSGWQIFWNLELPSAMIGLVWNSMMSMAGGWFIITVNEYFFIGSQTFALPGLGSYMHVAQDRQDWGAIWAGVTAMIVMIVAVDQLFWRPIVVWSQRFKLEDTAAADAPKSWVLEMFRHSGLLRWLRQSYGQWKRQRSLRLAARSARPPKAPRTKAPAWVRVAVWWCIAGILAIMALMGALKLVRLMAQLPLHDTDESKGWLAVLWALGLSFIRVMAALTIGAAWTLPAGVLIGLSPRWSNRLQPFVQIVASFPAPLVFPIVTLFMLWLRIPFTVACVGLMLLGTQWYTLFNVIAGAMAIPSELREAGRVYHMSRWQQWTRLYIPAVFPYLLTGLITAAGGAWNATIVAELNQVPIHGQMSTFVAYGLGYLITDAQANNEYALLTAAAVSMALFVIVFNRLFWRRIYRFAEERFSLNV